MGLTTKVKAAIELMVFDAVARPAAAKAVGLSDISLRLAFRNPVVMAHYREQEDVLRTSERPRSIHKIATLRDKAKSERVQLDAAKYLDGGDKAGGISVNVNVANITPGYQVVMPSEHVGAAHQILNLAHSTRNLLMDKDSVATPADETPE